MKLYFNADDAEFCYPLKYWIGQMELDELPEIRLYEAKRETDVDHFFCKFYSVVGLKSEGGCGRFCDAYKPRNGKNGRCVHSGFCYDITDKIITIKNKKLKELTA